MPTFNLSLLLILYSPSENHVRTLVSSHHQLPNRASHCSDLRNPSGHPEGRLDPADWCVLPREDKHSAGLTGRTYFFVLGLCVTPVDAWPAESVQMLLIFGQDLRELRKSVRCCHSPCSANTRSLIGTVLLQRNGGTLRLIINAGPAALDRMRCEGTPSFFLDRFLLGVALTQSCLVFTCIPFSAIPSPE